MARHLLLVIVILSSCPLLRGAESIRQKLQTTVHDYNLSEPTLVDALVSVASRFEIPIGAEIAASPSVLRPVRLSFQRTTAMGIFETLARDQEGLHLRVDDGIVHIFQNDLDNQPSNFLNIRIERFDVQNTPAPVAWQKLWEIVNARFQPPKPLTPGPHGTLSSGLGGFGDVTFSLDLRERTVRDILDKIAISSNYPIWVVAFDPGKSLTSTGFRRTASPTTGKVHELGWEMLRWGEKPY